MKIIILLTVSLEVGSIVMTTEIYRLVPEDGGYVYLVYSCVTQGCLVELGILLGIIVVARANTINNVTRRSIVVREPYQNVIVDV
jgi:hypothetical protein